MTANFQHLAKSPNIIPATGVRGGLVLVSIGLPAFWRFAWSCSLRISAFIPFQCPFPGRVADYQSSEIVELIGTGFICGSILLLNRLRARDRLEADKARAVLERHLLVLLVAEDQRHLAGPDVADLVVDPHALLT